MNRILRAASLALLVPGLLFAQQQPSAPPSSDAPPAAASTPAPVDAPQPQPAPALPDEPAALEPTGPIAVFDTSMGRIVCRLFDKEAPVTVANFVGLAEGTKDWTNPETKQPEHGKPLYDGTIFHRVIPGFMIQGGDPMGNGSGDPGYLFNDEFNPNLNFDVPGRLAMANSGPDTDGSQFFITEAPQDHLNQHYTIFGQCDDHSVLVVQSIARVERDANDKPLTPVVLEKVTIVPPGQPLPPAPVQPREPSTPNTPGTTPSPGAPTQTATPPGGAGV